MVGGFKYQIWWRSFGVALLTLVSTPLYAQDDARADTLFVEAREHMRRGEPLEARAKLEESYRLDPSLGTLLNLALCEQQLGHVATASAKLRDFIAQAPAGDSRIPLAERKLAALASQLPQLRIMAPNVGGLRIQLDGVELDAASLGAPFAVDPGRHVLSVLATTGERADTPLEIGQAGLHEVHLSQLGGVSTDTAPAALPQPVEPAAPGPASHTLNARQLSPSASPRPGAMSPIWYVVGSAGIAGLLVSGTFGILALNAKSDVRERCPNHTCEDQADLAVARAGARYQTVANVSFIVGMIGMASAGIVWARAAGTQASVVVAPGSASLLFVRSL
jgi:hypothetical protein